MTSSGDRPNTALLVIDMQVDVVEGAHDLENVVANINTLIEQARAVGAPIVWIQHAHDEELAVGTPGWEYIPELERRPDEPLIHKRYRNSFDDTDLDAVLRAGGVGHVVVTGAQTEFCVRNTLHGALAHGYDATLVADAHTTEDLRRFGSPVSPADAIAHTNLNWAGTSCPGFTGTVAPAAEIDFSG